MARLGPFVDPQKSPRKSLSGSLFASCSQEMRHIKAQNGVCWVGAEKFMLKKFMCFFGPLVKRDAQV